MKDEQRKAMFANIFGRNSSKRTKVRGFGSVTNFEVQRTDKIHKPSYFNKNNTKRQPVRLEDLKERPISESCKMCKKKELPLSSRMCKECRKELIRFNAEQKRNRKNLLPREMEDLIFDLENLDSSVDMIIYTSGDMDISEEEWGKLERETKVLTEKIGDFAEQGRLSKVAENMKEVRKLWKKFNDDKGISLQIEDDTLFPNSISIIKSKLNVRTL